MICIQNTRQDEYINVLLIIVMSTLPMTHMHAYIYMNPT